jgi:Tfp pilus assembly protein PilZ
MNDAAVKGPANGQPAGARPAVLSLSIKEKAALYAAYIPDPYAA